MALAMTKQMKEYIHAAEREGYQLVDYKVNRHHRMVFRRNDGKTGLVFAPATPGDVRNIRNFITKLGKAFDEHVPGHRGR